MGTQGRKVKGLYLITLESKNFVLTDRSGDMPVGLSISKDNVHVISLHPALLKGYKIQVTTLDIFTGKPGSQHTLSSESEVSAEDSILLIGSNSAAPLIVWTDNSFKVLKFNLIGTKHVGSINIYSEGRETTKKISVHAPRIASSPPHFLVHYQSLSSHWAEVYHVDTASGAARKAYSLPEIGSVGAFSSSTEGEKVYFTRHTEFEIVLYSSTAPDPIQSWSVRPKSHGGLANPQGIMHAVSEVAPKGPSSFAVRSALTLSSGDWELVRNGDPVWLRAESLAGTIAAAWVEITQEEGLAQELATESDSGLLAAYVHRLKRHIGDIITYFPGWIENLPKWIMGLVVSNKAAQQDQTVNQDNFGFRKIIIVATEHGRLAALDTGNQGNVLWNIKAVDLVAEQKWQVQHIKVEGSIVEARGLEGEFLRVRALTGEVLQHQPGGVVASLKTSAYILDKLGNEIFIAINKDGSVAVPYGTQFERETVLTTQGNDNIARGWTFGPEAQPSLAWEFVPASGEQILNLNNRPAQDSVASIGKALGDRNVMYKYLNPNLLLITTIDKASSKVALYLLDSTSGEVIYTARHAGVDTARPIVSTITENWLAYTFHLTPSTGSPTEALKGYQLVISELFESSIPNDRGPLGSTSNFSNVRTTAIDSSSTLSSPYVISQAYFLPGPISHLATTTTLQSITPRSLLAILPSLSGILSIPRNVIDPRRPVGRDPTPAEAEEGLFRHSPNLDFEPKWMITHGRDVMGLTNVITAPSKLESTSLVFAYGALDLFGTRLSPIGAFDLLGKGFSRGQLVLTVVGLGIGTGALAPMVCQATIPCFFRHRDL